MEHHRMNRTRIGLCLLVAFLCSNSVNAEIYKWTDEQGNVHFSDQVPANKKQKADSVDVSGAHPSGVDVEAANATAERIRNAAQSTAQANRNRERAQQARTGADQNSQNTSPLSSSSTPKERRNKFEQAMKQYEKAQRCFAGYRDFEGHLRPGAFDNCPDVQKPRQSDYY